MLPKFIAAFMILVLTTASPLQPIILPSNALIASSQPKNLSADSLEKPFGEPEIRCKGNEYGVDLRLDSCREMIERQIVLIGPETFRPRRFPPEATPATYPTPFLFASADGRCSLEVFQTDATEHVEDISELKAAAEIMFSRCVLNGGRQGSIARNLGLSQKLGLIMRSYEPRVTCRERLTQVQAVPLWCELLFRSFPASKVRRTFAGGLPFGPQTATVPWEIKTPHVLPRRHSLSMYVSSSAGSEESTWFDIYAAATVVWAICGEQGRGDNGALSVELREVV
ncbi:MAG: hypothetical protein Q9223_006801 [Gallowayella weberi]